jgi:SPP1 gp7 family putative phage head morphogenesis protein
MGAALVHALRMASVMRADPRPLKLRKWPRPRWPHGPRLEYYRVLVQLVEAVQRVVLRDLIPKLPSILGAHNVMRPEPEAIRLDATGSEVDDAFAALQQEAERVVPEHVIEMAAQKNALRVSEFNGNELQKQIQRVAKVNLFDSAMGLAEHLEVFVADNVALVKSLAFGQLDDLKGIVMRGARQGLHHTAVADQIEARFGVTKRRAALIATDQVGKLNGELNSLRQQSIGVRRYRWSGSQDERVRHGHRVLEGTIQEWTKPPVVDQRTGERGHPGEPIRCRCSPIPIIDDVLADAGLMDPAEVELEQPQRARLPRLPPTLPRPPPANREARRAGKRR